MQYSSEFSHLNTVKIMEIVYHSKPKFTRKMETINMLHFSFTATKTVGVGEEVEENKDGKREREEKTRFSTCKLSLPTVQDSARGTKGVWESEKEN